MMMKKRYDEYLKSAEWKLIKKLKLKQTDYVCQGCLERGRVLEVHHLTYDRIGMELLTDLAVYCTECHNKAHGKVEPSEWNKYLNSETSVKPKAKLVQDIELEKLINSI